jgi:hypothetical protein
MSEENKDTYEIPKSLADLLGGASAQITYENMTKLCNQNEYEIPEGSGVKWYRNILKPKQLVTFYKLQQTMDTLKDPEKRMDNLKLQAQTCLRIADGKDFEKEWEETDAVHMEIVLGACMLIARGFRKI